jgi:ATP-dependent DNA helicase DinG
MTTSCNGNSRIKQAVLNGTPQDVIEFYESLSTYTETHTFGPFDSNLVVIDTETTGISFYHDELIQIAAARIEQGKVSDWFITFVNPGKVIPEDIAHLTHISNEDVAGAPTPQEALTQLVTFVGDATLVAHNANFDKTFVTKHPEGYALLENDWVDSLDLSRIALPRMKSHRLIDLVRAFGAPESTHRADDDVQATCVLLRILLAAIDIMPPALVAEIASMAEPQDWSSVVVFKYFAELNKSRGFNESFSLRLMRQERLRALEIKPLKDAQKALEDEKPLVFPTKEQLHQEFSTEGIIGRLYDSYEERPEQQEMSEAVRTTFSQSRNLVVEAGTGVGKSMAYLLPSALTALENTISVGVATKTNALLDQLVFHELPALSEALDHKLTYAALKGMAHYPCLHRIERIVTEGPQLRTVGKEVKHQAPALAALLSFINQTEFDDIDSLKIDYRTLPRKSITTTSHDCLRRKCPFYGVSCYVHGARRKAEASHIVVTNQSLLFCDTAADGGLLPPIRYWVVDEAHGAEDEARQAFSLELAEDTLLTLAQKVGSTESRSNIFLRAERKVVILGSNENNTLFYGLTYKAKEAGSAFGEKVTEFNKLLPNLLYFDPNKKSKGYDQVELWLNDEIRQSTVFKPLVETGHALITTAEKLITVSQEIVGFLEEIEGAALIQREIASMVIELKETIQAAELITQKQTDEYVFAAILSKKNERNSNKLCALLYNVGEKLNDTLYKNTHSVVYASATLSVGDSFESFNNALGLNRSEASQANELKLSSSYNFNEQMVVYVVNDIPEPQDPHYLEFLQSLLIGVHKAQEGSFLTLFTNRREMEKCFEVVQPKLKSENLRLVCQKWGVSIKGLRDDFLTDKHLSLFALKSFWEGFDAPGSTLRGVVIPKLPFSKPTDPLSSERQARDSYAWKKFVLPAAVIETKQAAGRLIRKADDSGVLILADKRLLTKNYGKTFLKSLPSQNIKVLSAEEIINEIALQTQQENSQSE